VRRKEEAARRRGAPSGSRKSRVDDAQRKHRKRSETLDGERAALEKRVQAEDARWRAEGQADVRPSWRAGIGGNIGKNKEFDPGTYVARSSLLVDR
jgi:hypothetical protein